MTSLRGKKFTNDQLRALPRLKSIKRLSLLNTAVTDDGMTALEAAESLQEIEIVSDFLSNAALEILSQLPSLVSILIRRAPGIDDRGLRSLSKCVRLHELYLDSTSITDKGLSHIGQLPEVWSLILDHTPISDEGCAALRGMRKLSLLSLNHTHITGATLGGFSAEESLDIYADYTRATDAGVIALAKNQPNLRRISLIGTDIGDQAAIALAKLPEIGDVRLSKTKITDRGALAFAGCPNLCELYLEETSVSPAAIKALQKSSRKLTIYEPGWRR